MIHHLNSKKVKHFYDNRWVKQILLFLYSDSETMRCYRFFRICVDYECLELLFEELLIFLGGKPFSFLDEGSKRTLKFMKFWYGN
jgi:hypothetical protein